LLTLRFGESVALPKRKTREVSVKTGRFKLLILLDILTFIASVAYSQTTTTFSVATTEATAITAGSAELHGSINPGGSSAAAWFDWGTTTSLGNRTDAR